MTDMATRSGAPASPTIYDVAQAAGVSPSTVSRAFSRPGRVNAETAERIRTIARELGYRAKPIAWGTAQQRTGMIAFVISDMANPFYAQLISGAQSAASAAGYVIVLVNTAESGETERVTLERALDAVDGVILSSSRMSDSSIRVIAKQRPSVVLNRVLSDVHSIITDTERGASRVIEHLHALGHRSLAYVGGPASSWTEGMRFRSLKDSGDRVGLTVNRVGSYEPTVSSGARAVVDIPLQSTTAVVAYNDLMAIGVMRALDERGLRVPDDISVVGFDNIFAGELTTPRLTTVAAPLFQVGETAVRNLLAFLNGGRSRALVPLIVPSTLLLRDSTGPARHLGRRRSTPRSAR